MSYDPDALLDRRRLKRRLHVWQAITLLVVVGAVLVLLQGRNALLHGEYIARVQIEGLIVRDDARNRTLARLAEDADVRAVIVHIDSPGGSVVGGEDLYRGLRSISEAKPVVAVMGTVATSAAYMAALAADRIFAREGSITGSIGIILQSANVLELLGKVGVEPVTIKSSELKGIPSPVEPLTPVGRAATEADPGERGVFISRAQRALDNARAADPSDADAWVGTALLHSARGDEGKTAGAFRMASDLGAGREADVYRALSGLRAAAEVAAAAASEGAFKPTHDAGTKVTSVGGAYAAARRAVEAAPGDPTARLSLALASEAKGLFVEAASAYDDAAALLSHRATHAGHDTRTGHATHAGDTHGNVLAHEASAGAERARSGAERGAPTTGTLEGSETTDANVDDVASIAAYVCSSRATFRQRSESHARVARVEALAGAAAALAGDPNAAARSLAKAVHLSPLDVAIRGDLARVLPATDASGAATRTFTRLRARSESMSSIHCGSWASSVSCAIGSSTTSSVSPSAGPDAATLIASGTVCSTHARCFQ